MPTDRRTDRQVGSQTAGWMDGWADRQETPTESQTERQKRNTRQMDGQTERERDRRAEREAQAGRKTNRSADRQAEDRHRRTTNHPYMYTLPIAQLAERYILVVSASSSADHVPPGTIPEEILCLARTGQASSYCQSSSGDLNQQEITNHNNQSTTCLCCLVSDDQTEVQRLHYIAGGPSERNGIAACLRLLLRIYRQEAGRHQPGLCHSLS